MTALIGAVFVASLLGSLHCAGMCGAFLAFAVGAGDGRRTTRLVAYNLGRLLTYAALGAAAGAIGGAIDLGGAAVGVPRVAAVLAGALMVAWGVGALARLRGCRLPRAPVPAWLKGAVASGHRAVFTWRPAARALAVGLLTTLLPCGWLYAFAVTAAGTGDALLGALTMGVFWAGTLPVMVSLGVGVQRMTGALRARLPALTACLLVGVGLWTVAGRLALPALAHGTTADASIERVEHLEAECCTDDR